jgi:hypothetical protein
MTIIGPISRRVGSPDERQQDRRDRDEAQTDEEQRRKRRQAQLDDDELHAPAQRHQHRAGDLDRGHRNFFHDRMVHK